MVNVFAYKEIWKFLQHTLSLMILVNILVSTPYKAGIYFKSRNTHLYHYFNAQMNDRLVSISNTLSTWSLPMWRGGGGGRGGREEKHVRKIKISISPPPPYFMTPPPPTHHLISPIICLVTIKLHVTYIHKMITFHNNGTNLLNHKISSSCRLVTSFSSQF